MIGLSSTQSIRAVADAADDFVTATVSGQQITGGVPAYGVLGQAQIVVAGSIVYTKTSGMSATVARPM